MALIKSISGIRGTIGGKAGDGFFSPLDIIRFTTAFSFFSLKTGRANQTQRLLLAKMPGFRAQWLKSLLLVP